MIRREDLVVGAEFIRSDGYDRETRVVKFVGDVFVVYKAGKYEYSLPIIKAIKAWSPKPTPPEVRYLNIYRGFYVAAYKTRQEADSAAGGRVACVRVEYREGQYDD